MRRRRAPRSEPASAPEAIPELADLFDPVLLTSYERDSIEKRLANARRYARRLADAARTLRAPARAENLPHGDAPLRESLARAVVREVVSAGRPGLKRSVSRRMCDAIGRHYLWSSLSSLPVYHELTVLGPWALATSRLPSFERLVDYLSREFLNGIVLHLDQVREQVLSSHEVFLAHCACRSAGVADDLEHDGDLFIMVGEQDQRRLLDRLIDRYDHLDRARVKATTGARMRSLLDDLSEARRSGSSRYRLETFLRATWPDWEILPVLEGYTTRWIRSLQTNRKCQPVDRELVFEMLNIWYFGRGVIFTSMKAVDTPYTICTCPSPEHGGGCTLTNWYYYGGLNHSLIPAEAPGARLRDSRGRVLPCRYFPVRARRPCLGCGCEHSGARPRDLDAGLQAADDMLGRFGLRLQGG